MNKKPLEEMTFQLGIEVIVRGAIHFKPSSGTLPPHIPMLKLK